MPGDSKNDGEDVTGDVSNTSPETESKGTQKKKRWWLTRIFAAIFSSGKDDFEKRLEHLSKEEATVLTRIRKRSQNWRRIVTHFILLSVVFEVIAVVYAIMTTRTVEMHWKIRAFKVSPMFLLPGLSFLTYSALSKLNNIFVRKDQKTLERLRSERQAKINELKEKTNYYITQQLIQRYDPDPAAKAAAASVLASKLGADSGLKVYMGDDSQSTTPMGKSADVEVVPSNGLRNRKKGQARVSADNAVFHSQDNTMHHETALDGTEIPQYQQLVVEHHPQTASSANDGGWLARVAALLVGDDPAHSFALICGNCHMHNGLAREEDFPYVTYYCPHCNALNRPKQLDQLNPESSSPDLSTLTTGNDVDLIETISGAIAEEPSTPTETSTPVVAAATATETGQVVLDDSVN